MNFRAKKKINRSRVVAFFPLVFNEILGGFRLLGVAIVLSHEPTNR